jgi:hypothetical protein
MQVSIAWIVFHKPALRQGTTSKLAEKCKLWSKKHQGTTSKLAEKCKLWSKKRQGTTSVVPLRQQNKRGL